MDSKSLAAMLVAKDDAEVDGMSHTSAMGSDDLELGEDGEVDPGQEAAAEEMISAFEAKDARGLVTALKSFFDMVR